MEKITRIEDCFTEKGEFIIREFDPFRTFEPNDERIKELYDFLFDEDGFATKAYEVSQLIRNNGWSVFSDAVKYYYAHHCLDDNCKGNYTALYAWRN